MLVKCNSTSFALPHNMYVPLHVHTHAHTHTHTHAHAHTSPSWRTVKWNTLASLSPPTLPLHSLSFSGGSHFFSFKKGPLRCVCKCVGVFVCTHVCMFCVYICISECGLKLNALILFTIWCYCMYCIGETSSTCQWCPHFEFLVGQFHLG